MWTSKYLLLKIANCEFKRKQRKTNCLNRLKHYLAEIVLLQT
jgi:hypothetical protein